MPNAHNVVAPFLVIGAGRTASTYFLDILHQRGDTQTLIENTVVMSLRQLCLEDWWSPRWPNECDSPELEERLVKASRLAMTALFPSQHPFWAYKAIWELIDWDFYERVYPAAKYVHLVRDPRTNIASMMDYIGGDHGQGHWTLEYSTKKYIDSNRKALDLSKRDLPYFRVQQERFVAEPELTWAEIFDFLQLDHCDLAFTKEVNTARSTRGKVGHKRSANRIHWKDVSAEARALALELGYGP